MKRIGLILSALLCFFVYAKGQNASLSQRLISQGAWFLYSLRTEEQVGEEVLMQQEFYKKDDISSIFFDHENKLYTVFSKYNGDVFEDRWKVVSDTHFVMVSPVDGSSQLMEILEMNTHKLVLRNCGDIENGKSCSLYTYLSTKEAWLPDSEIDNLNAVGIVQIDQITP